MRKLSGRAGSAASWLDGRDPGSLVDEVKQFAAQKPGTFIAIAAGAGLLAGRLTKALAADAKSDSPAPAATTDPAHFPVTAEPAASYERTATQFANTPIDPGTVHVAPTPSFDDIVGEPPYGEER
ncbi:hypothetical protein [Frondihabitans sp. VKM Ac-2883]|uniref:hypothetical protein n=1 Tax=Frondihabitans sp. VKM Ac-2883 TaxID=2783823 RepID=UPI00188B2300|nr:hypothetical protein [Frondihabitans sp. VKM Ac-2883]MBF4577558.1 hypothetical protein [Frondihabitans sp. VKM Ac-2883]